MSKFLVPFLVLVQSAFAFASEGTRFEIVNKNENFNERISLACADERCDRFVFVEVKDGKPLVLNAKEYTAAEVSALFETLSSSIRTEKEGFYEFTWNLLKGTFSPHSSDLFGQVFVTALGLGASAVTFVVETVYRPFYYGVVYVSDGVKEKKVKKILRPVGSPEKIKQVFMSSGNYWALRDKIAAL